MTEQEKIHKLERILQATVEAVRSLDLVGFQIELSVYDHYYPDCATPLALAALKLPEFKWRVNQGDTDAVKRDYGTTQKGSWELTFFAAKKNLPKPKKERQAEVVMADPKLKETLTEIVEA